MPDARNLPLFRWGDQLRVDRDSRRRRRRIAIWTSIALGLIALPAITAPQPLLVWNASASAPLGHYGVTPPSALTRGDMVVLWLPQSTRRLAASRHYLPANVPAVKRIVAIAGDHVCARGDTVRVGGRLIVHRLPHDRRGRPLPAWNGCRRLASGEIFLLMMGASASFDSRYFGPVASRNVIGRAHLLWRR
jgi:conjugative transfer signal peptidase TraF